MPAVFVVLIGFLIRVRCIQVLGSGFSNTLRVPDRDYETQHWLYRYARHPMYVGAVLMHIGAWGISPTLGFLYLVLTFYRARAYEEERLQLRGRNWKQYARYMSGTGMFVPRFKTRGSE